VRDRGSQQADDDRQRDDRNGRAVERRPPAAGDADREHDRQRLDHLDRARQEGGAEEKCGVRHADAFAVAGL
jgi:hypothetical protein